MVRANLRKFIILNYLQPVLAKQRTEQVFRIRRNLSDWNEIKFFVNASDVKGKVRDKIVVIRLQPFTDIL